MTRWFLTTLALTCHVALSHVGHAQQVVGPQAYPSAPYGGQAFGPDGFPVAPELIPSPRDRGFLYDTDSQIDLDIRETLERSWVRMEYLNWDVTNPGRVFLGAPLAGFDLQGAYPNGSGQAGPGTTPPYSSAAFPVQDPFGTRSGVYGFVPDLGSVDWGHVNGLRGTIGIPLRPFTFEGSAWTMAHRDFNQHFEPELFIVNGTLVQTLIPVVTLFNNGALSNNAMVAFDASYDARVGINLFGADTNLVMNPLQPGNPIQVQPLVGLKYIQYKNDLNITGADLVNGTAPAIGSVAENNNFGPQVGLRFSYDSKWLSISADPKFAFGINRHTDAVSSSQLFSPTEADRTVQEEETSFAPIFDFNVNGRIHMSQHFSIFVSYNFLAIGRQSTSWENIYYNAPPNPLTDGSALGLNVTKKSVIAHGITVGGELRFR